MCECVFTGCVCAYVSVCVFVCRAAVCCHCESVRVLRVSGRYPGGLIWRPLGYLQDKRSPPSLAVSGQWRSRG